MIWRAVDRKPTEFLAALKMPGYLWDFFYNLDSVFGIMERVQADKQAAKMQGDGSKLPAPRKR